MDHGLNSAIAVEKSGNEKYPDAVSRNEKSRMEKSKMGESRLEKSGLVMNSTL